jgi:hypothetical protein
MMPLSDAAKAFLSALASPDAAARQDALQKHPLPASETAAVLPGLAELMGGADRAVAKTAREAMEALVHRSLAPVSGKNRPDPAVRARTAAALREIAAASARPRLVRAHALCLLGFAGDGSADEKALAALENDPELGDDAHMARQRLRSARY